VKAPTGISDSSIWYKWWNHMEGLFCPWVSDQFEKTLQFLLFKFLRIICSIKKFQND